MDSREEWSIRRVWCVVERKWLKRTISSASAPIGKMKNTCMTTTADTAKRTEIPIDAAAEAFMKGLHTRVGYVVYQASWDESRRRYQVVWQRSRLGLNWSCQNGNAFSSYSVTENVIDWREIFHEVIFVDRGLPSIQYTKATSVQDDRNAVAPWIFSKTWVLTRFATWRKMRKFCEGTVKESSARERKWMKNYLV